MKVFLRCAGGIGNVRMEGQVETSDLAEDLAKKVEKVLAPEGLESLASTASSAGSSMGSMGSGPFMADVQEVEISVQTQATEAQSVRLNEAELSDEVIEVIDELRYEITRKKAQALGRDVP